MGFEAWKWRSCLCSKWSYRPTWASQTTRSWDHWSRQRSLLYAQPSRKVLLFSNFLFLPLFLCICFWFLVSNLDFLRAEFLILFSLCFVLCSYECKLCLTLHNNEGNYLAHTQGKRHQTNLAKRAAREAKDAPAQPQPHKRKVSLRKSGMLLVHFSFLFMGYVQFTRFKCFVNVLFEK